MPNSVSEGAVSLDSVPTTRVGQAIGVVLLAWLGAVAFLGATGAYLGRAGQPPLAVFASAVMPLVMFGIAWRASAAFREFLLAIDIRFIVEVQAWRFAGFGFIALYTANVLPGLFAWPAGLGDMAIGIAAPFWIVRLIQNPEAIASRGFRLWNSLGILDFVVAFTTATISAITIAADTTPSIIGMGKLPLALIPTFMVPLFAMLHIVALMQARARR